MTQVYAPTHRGNRRNLWAPLTVLAAAAVIGGVIVTVFLTTEPDSSRGASQNSLFDTTSPLVEASTTCAAGTLADKDHTLMVDMAGETPGTGPDTFDDVSCVLAELDTPRAVVARMESTRALDGMQSATWSTYEATWNYHPDDGLDLIITHESKNP